MNQHQAIILNSIEPLPTGFFLGSEHMDWDLFQPVSAAIPMSEFTSLKDVLFHGTRNGHLPRRLAPGDILLVKASVSDDDGQRKTVFIAAFLWPAPHCVHLLRFAEFQGGVGGRLADVSEICSGFELDGEMQCISLVGVRVSSDQNARLTSFFHAVTESTGS